MEDIQSNFGEDMVKGLSCDEALENTINVALNGGRYIECPRWDDMSIGRHIIPAGDIRYVSRHGHISSQWGTFDMSPGIEGNIYYLIPKVNNYEIRPIIWTFRP
jgi:hypothetical protein